MTAFFCILSSFFVLGWFCVNYPLKEPIQALGITPKAKDSTNLSRQALELSEHKGLTIQGEHAAEESNLDQKDSRYSDRDLAEAMDALATLRNQVESDDQYQHITEEEVLSVWRKVDRAKHKGYILPAESIFYKQWSVNLVDSPHLRVQLNQEIQAFEDELNVGVGSESEKQTYANYKSEEQRITKEVLAQYPNDEVKALDVLENELTTLRVRMYNTAD